MSERERELADKIRVNDDGGVTLPKLEWKGWTLSQEMASFDAAEKEQPK